VTASAATQVSITSNQDSRLFNFFKVGERNMLSIWHRSSCMPLNDSEVQALSETLDDEYKSRETYAQVMRDFGEVRPFINIVDAEARHANALLGLFQKYGIAPPANRWVTQAPRFASIHEACAACVQGEIENVALYDRALKSTQRPDILTVYHALRSASQDRHLPAFQRCVQRRPSG
jgi:hypothetical protein